MSKQAGILIVGRFLAFLLSFILPVVLVRIFNKQQFGLYRQLLLINIAFFPILQLGISQSLYYFYPREESKRALLIQQSFFFLILTGLIFFIIMFFFKNIFASYFFHNALMVKTLPLIGLFTGLMVPTSILEILLIVEKRVKLASLITIISAALRALLVLFFAFTLKSIYFLIVGLVIFSGIRLLFLTGYIINNYKKLEKFDLSFLKKQLLYAIPFGLAVIMVTFNTTLDKFTITYLFTPALYAIYSVGCYQIPIISITLNAVVSIILPQISLFQKDRRTFEILDLWHRAIRKLALIGFPVFVFFFTFAKEFITFLFTLKYANSTPIFRVFLFVILIDATIYGVILRAYGKTSYIFLSSVFSFVIALAFIYPACKFFGLQGAATVVVSAHALLAIFQLIKSKSLLEIKIAQLLPWKILFKILMIAILSVSLLIPIKYLHFLNSFSILAISSILFFLIYLLFIWNIPLLTMGEKKQFKGYLSKIRYFFAGETH